MPSLKDLGNVTDGVTGGTDAWSVDAITESAEGTGARATTGCAAIVFGVAGPEQRGLFIHGLDI